MDFKFYPLALAGWFLYQGTALQAQNVFTRLGNGLQYAAEAQLTTGEGNTPLWLNANRYGLSATEQNNGYIRAALHRTTATDSMHNWRLGFGIDLAAANHFTNSLIVQQLYAELEYKKVRLAFGSKERPMQLKNQELSSGSQTFGINARPIPELRIEIPEYLSLTGRSNWIGLKGHIGYGMLTDGGWQKDYVGESGKYAQHVLYHSKAGYLRIGNEERFPLTAEGGLEMAGIFGGDVYQNGTHIDMGHSLTSIGKIFLGIGHDPTDGKYPNAEGDILGSWLFRLNYKWNDWRFSVYYDHFFEDHSMLFFQYGWKDGLIGTEVAFPQNPIADHLVYEYLTTEYQAGPIYQDYTSEIPTQISAKDNYYNHLIYNGWQHWGQAIGNPLYTSPLYNRDNRLYFPNNRFTAHHIGLSGQPLPTLRYRLLLSYSRNLGTYDMPFSNIRYNTSFGADLRFTPRRIGKWKNNGWSVQGAFALDRGKLLGNNTGMQITLRKQGTLKF